MPLQQQQCQQQNATNKTQKQQPKNPNQPTNQHQQWLEGDILSFFFIVFLVVVAILLFKLKRIRWTVLTKTKVVYGALELERKESGGKQGQLIYSLAAVIQQTYWPEDYSN